MLVALVNPLEIAVLVIPARPVEARLPGSRIGRSLNGGSLQPMVRFGVPIGKGNGAGPAVKNGKRIDPTSGGSDIDNPRSQVVIARIGFFEEDHRFR